MWSQLISGIEKWHPISISIYRQKREEKWKEAGVYAVLSTFRPTASPSAFFYSPIYLFIESLIFVNKRIYYL